MQSRPERGVSRSTGESMQRAAELLSLGPDGRGERFGMSVVLAGDQSHLSDNLIDGSFTPNMV
jgi:hypothetical protein